LLALVYYILVLIVLVYRFGVFCSHGWYLPVVSPVPLLSSDVAIDMLISSTGLNDEVIDHSRRRKEDPFWEELFITIYY